MPVLQNADSMFFDVNADVQAGQKTLQKARLDMLVMPKLLNRSLFNLFV